MTERDAVTRLLWRAGFGPAPGEVEFWSRKGRNALVDHLLRPTGRRFAGEPRPSIDGKPLDPRNVVEHDVLWVLDGAVRTRQPLAERMGFVWHDHFAVSNASVGDTRLMLRYYRRLRNGSLGSLRGLARAMTLEPAVWVFLDLSYSHKDAPNENYARELFELFTLGANNGYTEADIREASRALTGFWWDSDLRRGGFDKASHDARRKVIFGKRGRFRPLDVVDLAISHEAHAPFICRKLWSELSTRECPDDLLKSMVNAYRRSGTQIAPTLEPALRHEAFYEGNEPDQVKGPLVYTAGMLRATGQGVRKVDWGWLLSSMGQSPFYPPNVSGWPTGTMWLSTATIKARFEAAALAVQGVDPKGVSEVEAAIRAAGSPWASEETIAQLREWARTSKRLPRPQRLRTLAQALLGGPDAQVC